MRVVATLVIRLRGDSLDDVLDVMADESGKLAQALTYLDDRYPYLSCIDQYGITVAWLHWRNDVLRKCTCLSR